MLPVLQLKQELSISYYRHHYYVNILKLKMNEIFRRLTNNRGFIWTLHLTHFMSLVSFYNPLKISGNQRFSDVSKEYSKRPLAWNGLIAWTQFTGSCWCTCLPSINNSLHFIIRPFTYVLLMFSMLTLRF